MNNENKFTTPPIVFDLEEKIQYLEDKLADAVEALEFYADINNYDLGGDCPNAAGAWEMVVNPSTMGVCGDEFIEDCGDVARKALVRLREKGEGE